MDTAIPIVLIVVGAIVAIVSTIGTIQDCDEAGCVFIVLGIAILCWGLYWL